MERHRVTIDGDGEVTVDVLAEGDSPLLAVHHLVGVLLGDDPVHDVQREAVANGVDDRVPLLVVVHELALVLGADVEPPAEADDALLGAIEVALGNLPNRNLLEVDLHSGAPVKVRLRTMMRM